MLAELARSADFLPALRRTMLVALVVAFLGLVAGVFLGYPLVGLGGCLGVAAGIVNLRGAARAVVVVQKSGNPRPRRPLAGRSIARLSVITAVSLLLLVFVTPMGAGVLLGLIFFQLDFLANLVVTMHSQRALLLGGGASAPGSSGAAG
jgi:hypothetical protein